MYRKLLLISAIASSLFADVDIDVLNKAMAQNYKAQVINQKLTQLEYEQMVEANFKYYQSVFQESQKYMQQFIGAKWGEDNAKLSSKTTFTQYEDDFHSRQSVDFKNGEITIEFLDDKFFDNIKAFEKKFNDLKSQTIEKSFLKDPVNQVAIKLLKDKNILKNTTLKDDEKLLDKDILKPIKLTKEDIKHKIVKTKQGDKKVSYIVIKMVSNQLQIKAKKYLPTVSNHTKRFDIKKSIVFGIIQTESDFNPMARSYVPAFGLMQIVPSTAGLDAYNALYHKKRILSPTYLYNANNNIEIGTKYIQIIQQQYLKGIKDKEKLFLCTTTAYNAGIGSLYRSLTSKTKKQPAIRKINQMSVKELYKHLSTSNKLTLEAREYIVKVKKNSANFLAWDE